MPYHGRVYEVCCVVLYNVCVVCCCLLQKKYVVRCVVFSGCSIEFRVSSLGKKLVRTSAYVRAVLPTNQYLYTRIVNTTRGEVPPCAENVNTVMILTI